MRLILLKPHTHAGCRHDAGVHIDLPQPIADWLIARGVAEADAPAPATDTAEPADHETPPDTEE